MPSIKPLLVCQEVRTDPRSHTGRDAKTKLKRTLCQLLQGDCMVGCRINSLVPRRRSCNLKFNTISLISPWTKWPPSVLADDNFKCIFLNASDRVPIRMSLTFVPRSPIDNNSAVVQVMAWHGAGDKPLSLVYTSVADCRRQSPTVLSLEQATTGDHWRLLLTWIDLNPSMVK